MVTVYLILVSVAPYPVMQILQYEILFGYTLILVVLYIFLEGHVFLVLSDITNTTVYF